MIQINLSSELKNWKPFARTNESWKPLTHTATKGNEESFSKTLL